MSRKNQVSAEVWQRARDLVASGIAMREVARRVGIRPTTLIGRVAREGWYRPSQNLPPQPPPIAPPIVQAAWARNSPPPNPKEYKATIALVHAQLRWSLEATGGMAAGNPQMAMWMVEKLPNVLKVLISADEAPIAQESKNLLEQLEDRIRSIQRPKARACDAGEIPDVRGGDCQ